MSGSDRTAPIHILHLNLGDWADGTAGLTLEQEGFYLRLIRRLYAGGGRLLDDDARNARRLGVDIRVYFRLKQFLIVERKIEVEDGCIVQRRVLRDLDEIKARRDNAAEYGRKGAEARKAKAFEEAKRAPSCPQFDGTSAGSSGEVGPKSAGSPAEVSGSNIENGCDFNAATMTSPPPPPNKKPHALRGETPEVREAFDAYNATATRLGLARAEKLTADRVRKIGARLADYGLDGWRKALGNIERSPFLLGKTTHQFNTDLDFVCQPSKFGKLYDGGYSSSNGGPPALRLLDFGDGEQHIPRYGGGRA